MKYFEEIPYDNEETEIKIMREQNNLIQKTLFTYICSEEGHNFGVVGDGYYKRTSDEIPIKDKVYRMILCNKCGEAKEICIRDRSQPVEKKTKKRGKK